MAFTATHLAELEATILAVTQGKAVTFNGRSVTRQDLPDLLKLRALMIAEINISAGGASSRLAATSKGT
jgi:hypothetical protein